MTRKRPPTQVNKLVSSQDYSSSTPNHSSPINCRIDGLSSVHQKWKRIAEQARVLELVVSPGTVAAACVMFDCISEGDDDYELPKHKEAHIVCRSSRMVRETIRFYPGTSIAQITENMAEERTMSTEKEQPFHTMAGAEQRREQKRIAALEKYSSPIPLFTTAAAQPQIKIRHRGWQPGQGI